MGLRKYRDVSEIPGPPPPSPGTPDHLRVACGLMELARRLHPAKLHPGVRKYRTHAALLQEEERRERDPGGKSGRS